MEHYGLDHSLKEHIADGVMHVLGLVFAVAGVSALLVWTTVSVPNVHKGPLIAYAAGLIATFTFSAAYNMTLHVDWRAILRRIDHAAIYIMIAGTYTPVAMLGIGGRAGLWLAIGAWALAILGVVLKLFFFDRCTKLGLALYLAQGWMVLLAAKPLWHAVPREALVLLVIGGLIYSLGSYLFHRRLPFVRAIWHGHVLAGSALHYAALVIMLKVGGV